MAKKNILLVIIFCIILSGCGYTTGSVISSKEPSIHVGNFVNKIDVTQEISNERPFYIYKPGTEASITRAVIDRFIFDGNYEIKDAENSRFLLKGELVDFRREPLRYDDNESVIEYRISVVTNLELYDTENNRTVWEENGFAGESTYRTTGQFAKSESTATQKAIEDIARRIVERTVENW